jgi:hypothetical protein
LVGARGAVDGPDQLEGVRPGDALRFDYPGDTSLLRAGLRAALEACALVAATDTLRDANVLERAMLEDTRRMWGTHDHTTHHDDNPRPPRP